jgi:hypothetical protein
MLNLTINDKNLESIFINEFSSNQDKFIEFIKSSFEKFQSQDSYNIADDIELVSPNDPDYQVMIDAKKGDNISLNEFMGL